MQMRELLPGWLADSERLKLQKIAELEEATWRLQERKKAADLALDKERKLQELLKGEFVCLLALLCTGFVAGRGPPSVCVLSKILQPRVVAFGNAKWKSLVRTSVFHAKRCVVVFIFCDVSCDQ